MKTRPPLHRFLWLLTIGYAAVVFTFTHLPPSRAPKVGRYDKLVHFGGYFVMAASLCCAARAGGGSTRGVILTALVALPLIAAADEWTQPWVGRSADVRDWLADVAGAAAGTLLTAPLAGRLLARGGRR